MNLVSSFEALLAGFLPLLTAPSFENLKVIARGWVFCLERRTVTRVLQVGGGIYQKHHSAFHRFFSRAQWCIDELSRVLLGMLLRFVPESETVYLSVDDTLCRKRGLHVFGTCMHHDPLLSCRKFAVVNWGHNWVVVGVNLRFSFAPGITWCLPFAFRLYISRTRPKSQRWREEHVHRTRPELAVEILQNVSRWFPDRDFHVIGDSAYGGKSVSKQLPARFHLTSRVHMRAELYSAPGPSAGGRGRPRKRGDRLPTPEEMAGIRTGWKSVRLTIYGKKKEVLTKQATGLWRAAGYRRVCVTVVRDPAKKTPDQAFFTTVLETTPEQVLERYAQRWSIEVAFQNTKSHFGFEDPQSRKRKAVERTAPLAMVLYSLVVAWFAQVGFKKYKAIDRPWYTRKSTPAFVDILITIRKESLREHFLNVCEWTPENRKTLRLFTEVLRLTG